MRQCSLFGFKFAILAAKKIAGLGAKIMGGSISGGLG